MNTEVKENNKIVTNFVGAFNDLMGVLHAVDGWPKHDVKIINDFKKQMPVLLSLIDENTVNIIFPFEAHRTEVVQTWDLWKKHLACCNVYYSPYSEAASINYISRLVEFNPQSFIYVLEYAMASGYSKINPDIISYAIPSQKPLIKTLFRDSTLVDFSKFKQQFGENYNNIDLKFYYDKVYLWSNSQGRLSADWISTAKSFIQKDAREGNLACLNSKKKQASEKAILGTVMQASALLNKHFGFIRTLPEEFWKNMKPKSFFDSLLTIEFSLEKSGLTKEKANEIAQQITNYINQNETEKIKTFFEIV